MGSLFDGTEFMDNITDIYNKMEANYPGSPCSKSEELWRLRRARDIADRNTSPEKMLEYAVANLSARGHMPGWSNQCPTASGINDSSRNRHSNVDLVHWDESNKCARLIELKWASDDPLYALREILRYGAAYLFCRVHENELHFPAESLIEKNVRHVSLEVVAPLVFYSCYNERARFARINKNLNGFAVSKTGGTLSMSLKALVFPKEFDRIPFNHGKEVKQKCFTRQLTPEGQEVRDAFNKLAQVWP